VAVFGASRREGKLGNTLLRNILEGGFGGRVVAVNPEAREVLGVPAVPALTEPVDLALISVPASAALDAVAQAASVGCRAAVVLSSGFAETGSEGRALQDRMALVAREAGMRLVGPNCMGVLSSRGEGFLNATYFWEIPRRPGNVSFASQSGAVGGMFLAQARRGRFGVARFVSLGNAADITASDVVEYLTADDLTEVIGIFAEAIQEGRRFVEAARTAGERKPVVVLKAGKERAGARAAVGHTGALAGPYGVAGAAFARAGVVVAADTDGFFDALAALAAHPAGGAGLRVAILTVSGGPGVLAADAAEALGLELPAPGPGTRDRLASLVPPFASLANPMDLTPQCPPERFVQAVAAVFDEPAFEGVIAIDCGLDAEGFGRGVADAAARTGKPAVAFVLDAPSVEGALAEGGVPVFDSPEDAVAGYLALIRRPPAVRAARRPSEGSGRQALSEWESKELLGARLPRPREARCEHPEEAVAFARSLGHPVVAKASGVVHKSDRGLVRLGLDPQGIADLFEELARAGDGTVLVAEEVAGEMELIVGGIRDPQFGPVGSIGLGGAAAEVDPDVAFLLLPPEPGEVDRAIGGLRAAPLLEGFRGWPPVDRRALAEIVGAISDLFARDPRVVEVDCNPVIVIGGRPVVVDALVVIG
jgi:acetyltransferase